MLSGKALKSYSAISKITTAPQTTIVPSLFGPVEKVQNKSPVQSPFLHAPVVPSPVTVIHGLIILGMPQVPSAIKQNGDKFGKVAIGVPRPLSP